MYINLRIVMGISMHLIRKWTRLIILHPLHLDGMYIPVT